MEQVIIILRLERQSEIAQSAIDSFGMVVIKVPPVHSRFVFSP